MATEDEHNSGDGADAPLRTVSDPTALRALAHPIRLALLEAIALRGSLTATEAAAIVGGSVPNTAYHLRTLGKHGYIVEAERAGGRERPWKLGTVGIRTDPDDADVITARAAQGLGAFMLEHWLARGRWYREHRTEYPAEVRAASTDSQYVLFATPAEVEQVQEQIHGLLMRFTDRIADPALRPAGSVPFELLMLSHPFEKPGTSNPPAEPEG